MDLTPFRELTRTTGPFASVFLDASHEVEDAAHVLDLRWRELRESLVTQGTDADTLRALDDAIRDRRPAVGRAGRGLVAAHGRVLVDRYLSTPPPQPTAHWGRLPHLTPLVTGQHRPVPHLVAVVDRLGADLHVVDHDGRVVVERSVQGEEHPAHKVGEGGFAHRKIQQRVENLAEQNASTVAEEIDRLVQQNAPRLLVLAGEVQARSAVADRLGRAARDILVETGIGGRAAGADEPALWREAQRLATERAAAEERDTVERFRAELGRHSGRAVTGLRRVATALRQGQVDTVLLAEDLPTDRTLWVGAEPNQLATEEAELRGEGASPVTPDRADAALLYALAATGGRVYVVHVTDEGRPELAEGVGALLRYA